MTEPELEPEEKPESEPQTKRKPKPLSFGIELEFCVGYVPRGTANPNPSDGRRVHFKDLSDYPASQNTPDGKPMTPTVIIQQDIIQTLVDKGYAAKSHNYSGQADDIPPEEWWLMSDSTISLPEDEPKGYEFVKIEIASPAWFACNRALKQVEAVIRLLEKTYYVVTNISTGLHVHVGRRKDGFQFEHMRDLIAILWAYEHQFSSIHPQSRVFNDQWHLPMRKHSNYARSKALGGRPIDGMNYFLSLTNMQVLLKEATCLRRHGEYNFANMMPRDDGIPIRKTIEFRGHEATFDSERIRNWILTVVGIVDWVRSASDFDKETLRLLARTEIWEKIGNEWDDMKEAKHGPILAEKDYTIVHLLKHMELYEPALFYHQRKLHKHMVRLDYDDLYVTSTRSKAADQI